MAWLSLPLCCIAGLVFLGWLLTRPMFHYTPLLVPSVVSVHITRDTDTIGLV